MTTILICLAIAALLPMLPHTFDIIFKFKQFGAYDNVEPRKQNAQLSGAGSRAVAAQLNAWEALGLFTAACVIVVLGKGNLDSAANAAVIFIIARVLHTIFYLIEQNKLRTSAYVIGLVASLYMMYLGINA